ncbi:hypothetical protein [Geoglobus acetivorans]|uniref:Uncharacterized protein n=1 Tax=Geoglobus acetivorans TaxID=565033 RepID=A0A0A7GJN0_GEOAI|nr:hypothetical protein GACE_2109 [Geoglobus acetivorans]
MQFDRWKYYLIYIEEFLEEYWETVDYSEYSRDEPRYEWKSFIKVEECRYVEDAFEIAWDLLNSIDYDHRITFIGIFKGDKMLYDSKDVVRIANEVHQEVTA